MNFRFTEDSVEITGYVNAVERDSKTLWSNVGEFIEKIKTGAFKKAIERNDDIHILLNHDKTRDLGSTKKGNLELVEDSIGLRAKATIYDKEVIEEARRGDLVGWSFGFYDRNVIKKVVDGILHREVEDMDLIEVSILDRKKTPAYSGTLIEARTQNIDKKMLRNGIFFDETKEDKETTDEEQKEKRSLQQNEVVNDKIIQKNIDYSEYESIIRKMKGEM